MADCEICFRREMRFVDKGFELGVCAECMADLSRALQLPIDLKALFSRRRLVGVAKQGRCDICNDRSIRVRSSVLGIDTCLTCSDRVRRRVNQDIVFEPVTTASEPSASEQGCAGDRSNRQAPPPEDRTGRSKGLSPYAVLDIEEGATREEIQTAYHRMAQMYHPDKVAHLAPEFREIADRRMKDINAAYAQLQNRVRKA
jgi:hypothetical protein